MAAEETTTDVEKYFKAVKEGDLGNLKEFLREKGIRADTTNKVQAKINNYCC